MNESAADRHARVARRHHGVPDEVIADQIAWVDQGVQLLGGGEELATTAEEAIDHNLDGYRDAQANPGNQPVDLDEQAAG